MKHIQIRRLLKNAVKVIIKNNTSTLKNLTIRIGDQLEVQPINKLSTKNRGRKCIIMNFIDDDLGHISQAKVKFLDTNRNGKVLLSDLSSESNDLTSPSLPNNPSPALPRFLPQDVPDHLFTQKELKFMGLVPTQEIEAYVLYPEQKR